MQDTKRKQGEAGMKYLSELKEALQEEDFIVQII